MSDGATEAIGAGLVTSAGLVTGAGLVTAAGVADGSWAAALPPGRRRRPSRSVLESVERELSDRPDAWRHLCGDE